MDSNINRSVILPPYMEGVEIWEELMQIIDSVLKGKIDDPTAWLAQLRYLWIEASTAAGQIEAGQMLELIDFEVPEKEILIKQAAQLGFDFQDSDLIASEDYQRIVRNLAHFWYGKGKPNFIDFLGFVLNSQLTIRNLWSTQGPTYDTYGPMFEEGNAAIGLPIWKGGAWFPTTHVRLVFDPFKFATPSFAKLTNLFYAIANYNLVVESILLEGNTVIHSVDETTLARVAVAYPMWIVEQTIESL
jgi:hypothetical protein